MRKNPKKLVLSKETLSDLNNAVAKRVEGGTYYYSGDWKNPWDICIELDSSGC